MAPRHLLTINLNEQCAIDAGSWQECLAEGQRPCRFVSPSHITIYRQVLSYLEEVMGDQRDPPTSRLHFGEVAIATVAVCLRWGSYFAALVKAAVQLLPFPIAQLDGSTYSQRFRALVAFHSAHGRRFLMEAFARDFGAEWLERQRARVLVHPTRALANGVLHEHWRNGSGIEDVHAGAIAPPRPLLQRRLTRAQEALLMQEMAELFVPTMRALYHIVGKPSGETWPELALPYALAFKPPADWSLEELTREIVLPGAEPR